MYWYECLLTFFFALAVNQFLVCMYFISGRAVDDVIIADVCLATSSLVMCVIDVSDIYWLHGFHISFAYVYMTVLVVSFVLLFWDDCILPSRAFSFVLLLFVSRERLLSSQRPYKNNLDSTHCWFPMQLVSSACTANHTDTFLTTPHIRHTMFSVGV